MIGPIRLVAKSLNLHPVVRLEGVRMVYLPNGKIVEEGSVKDVLVNPQTDYTKLLVRAAFEIAT